MYLLEKQNVPISDEYSSVIDYTNFLIPRKLQVYNYDINLVFNCKEKKDERVWKYHLEFCSWDDIKLT